ncbi:low temperature requirement protein A [Nonomuraea sediminis]|uniref:low temperature requirement protein A n=1 Tax=Nonomuraea sediminis TaxID=2835864 RepID=UPI001BDD5AFB|nr:low temperature requirement protein A [Nonomuraea sediminis]
MTDPGERHASWLELFFDLVAVVAVAQLAHRLQHPTWLDVALFALLYYAVWSVWTSMSLYANVRGDKTRVRSMLLCMFGIAVMAAAAPDVGHALGSGTGDNTHDPWFIAAYVFCRAVAARSLQGSGNILISWPSVHIGVGVIPWVASLWIDPPAPGDPVAWRYVLWGLGVVLDLTFTIHASLSPDRVVKQAQEQAERLRKREESRRGHGLRTQEITVPTAAILHPAHLGERLGLFVIIVLGEAVMQVVVAASGKSWVKELGLAALGGFGLIVALWWLTLQYGLSAVPDASEKGLKPAVALPAHYVMTAGITATAAGLGVVAEAPSAHLHGGIVWVLCGGLALYFLASAVLGVANRAERRWLWGWALPTVVAPPVVAAIAGLVQAWLVVALLALVALWRVIYRASTPAPAEA